MKNYHSTVASVLVALSIAPLVASAEEISLVNVSYDPTRELYKSYNAAFAKHYKETVGDDVSIRQSHGGSGGQARSVISGTPADVVSLALALDIDEIARKGKLLGKDWQGKFPYNSSPYTSTIVFLVRKGNPKGIHSWEDLIKPGVEVITPNPKTGGGSRWNYLAAWGYIVDRELKGLEKVRASQKGKDAPYRDEVAAAEKVATEFVTELYRHVTVMDSGARGSTTTFLQRGIGDVLLAWENEAILALKEVKRTDVEIVAPPKSILCEPAVAVVEKNAKSRGEAVFKAANEYVNYLFSDEAQALIAKFGYRPVKPEVARKEDLDAFPKVNTFRLDELYKDWRTAQAVHFADGALFDRIYSKPK